MDKLKLEESRLADPDGTYAMLVEAHAGLDAISSMELNARLLLILLNQAENAELLPQALAIAREGLPDADREPAPGSPRADNI